MPDQPPVAVPGPASEQNVTEGMPPSLVRALRDPTIRLPQDDYKLANGRSLWEHLEEWRNAPSNTASGGPGPASVSPAEPPEYLSDVDGDVAFVRCDLGETPILAAEWALGQGVNLSQMEADPVEMLPVPEHFTDIEYEWAVVRGGTPDAVPYWRFRV